jgi:hypothetical protein
MTEVSLLAQALQLAQSSVLLLALALLLEQLAAMVLAMVRHTSLALLLVSLRQQVARQVHRIHHRHRQRHQPQHLKLLQVTRRYRNTYRLDNRADQDNSNLFPQCTLAWRRATQRQLHHWLVVVAMPEKLQAHKRF